MNGKRAITFGAFCAVFLSGAASAGALLQDTVQNCGTPDCNAQRIRGIYNPQQPFVAQAYAQAGECLRMSITRQTLDYEMTLVSPDSEEFTWNDDDSYGGFPDPLLRPLIKVDPVPVTGWYTVIISEFLGAKKKGNFDLRYARYPGGNSNCFDPTPPMTPSTVLRKGVMDSDDLKVN